MSNQAALLLTNGSIYQGEISRTSSGLVADGQGRIVNQEGEIFSGMFRDGKRVRGRMIYSSGCVYEGSFDVLNEYPNGAGKFIWPDGRTFEGSITHNRIHGIGDFTNFVPGCRDLVFSGASTNGTFSSSTQSTQLPAYLASYEAECFNSANLMFQEMINDLEQVIVAGPSNDNPRIKPFSDKYLIADSDTDPWCVGGIKSHLLTSSNLSTPFTTLKSLRLRLPALRSSAKVEMSLVKTNQAGYPKQLMREGQLLIAETSNLTIRLIRIETSWRVLDVVGGEVLDEQAALAALFADPIKKVTKK